MTWLLNDWRVYIHEAPKEWRPETLGRWHWNARHNVGGWERQEQTQTREEAFEKLLDFLQRADAGELSETYMATFEGEQFLITMSPFEDIGTLASRIFYAATGAEVIDLETLCFRWDGLELDMQSQCGVVWGREPLALERR